MKDILRQILVPALTSRPVSTLASRLFGYGIPIFIVHRLELDGSPVRGTTPGHLRRCLKYIYESGYKPVPLEDVIQALLNQTALPDKTVVFTMDDGFTEQADVAASIFIEFDCPLTFFVITDMLDQAMWPWDAQVSWIITATRNAALKIDIGDESINLAITDSESRHTARQTLRNILKEVDAEQLPDIMDRLARAADVPIPATAPPPYQPLNWQTARNLEQRGIRFAPHSKTHRILSKLSDATAKEEIIGSWDTLKRELSNPLKVFCYPTGRAFDFGSREIAYLKKAGFLGAASSIPGQLDFSIQTEDRAFCLPRVTLPDSMAYFIQCCSWIEHFSQGIVFRSR